MTVGRRSLTPSRVYLAFILEIIGKTQLPRNGKESRKPTPSSARSGGNDFIASPMIVSFSRSLESRMRIEKRSRKRARDVKPRGERRWEPEASRREEFPWMPRPSAESEKSITSATLVGKAQSHWLSSRGPRYGTREQPQLGQSVRPERKREKPCKSSFRGVSRGASSCRLTRTARDERRRWTSERTKEASGQRSAEASTGALLLWASYNIPVSSAVEQRAPPFASWMTIRRRETVGSVAGLRDAGWVIASLTDRYYACHRTHAARDLTAS